MYVKNKAGLTGQAVPGRRIPGHWPPPSLEGAGEPWTSWTFPCCLLPTSACGMTTFPYFDWSQSRKARVKLCLEQPLVRLESSLESLGPGEFYHGAQKPTGRTGTCFFWDRDGRNLSLWSRYLIRARRVAGSCSPEVHDTATADG